MPACYDYTCDHCSHTFATNGTWRYTRDRWSGKETPYGDPHAWDPYVERFGFKRLRVTHLRALVYCPACDANHDLIVKDFSRPFPYYLREDLFIFGGKKVLHLKETNKYKGKKPLPCPSCGGMDLVLAPWEEREIACPRCKIGRMRGSMTAMV